MYTLDIDLRRLPTVPPSWPLTEDTTATTPLHSVYNEAAQLLADFHAKSQGIDDPGTEMFRRLTPTGRLEERRALAERTLEGMAKLRARPAVALAPQRILSEYHTVRHASALGKPVDAVAALQARELRDWYANLDESRQLQARRHAVAAGDAALLSAILSPPSPAMQLVPEAERHAIEQAVIELHSPERFAELRAFELAYRCLDETFSRFEVYIAQAGGVKLAAAPVAYVPVLIGFPQAA
jgi:hypothetical protein